MFIVRGQERVMSRPERAMQKDKVYIPMAVRGDHVDAGLLETY